MIKNSWYTAALYSLAFFACQPYFCNAQSPEVQSSDFAEIFNPDYQKAVDFLYSNQYFFDSLQKWGIEPNYALAIVFPEILRYSAIRDWAETKSLEVLYTQYGGKYADFSIGYFQMKPSFAEEIERSWKIYHTVHPSQTFLRYSFPDPPSEHSRYERIERLSNKLWQLRYLAMFIFIMDEKYSGFKWPDLSGKLHFYATAYNTGFLKSFESIQNKSKQNYFHTKLLKPALCYNYGEIAVYYYLTSGSNRKIRK